MSEDLFGGTVGGQTTTPSGSLGDTDRAGLPLAVRMRPRTLEEILDKLPPGQEGIAQQVWFRDRVKYWLFGHR